MPDDGLDGVYHVPIMLTEVLDGLKCEVGGTYVDCTVGGGGHALGILQRLGSRGQLIGLDQDPDALAEAAQRLAPFREQTTLVRANFRQVADVLDDLHMKDVDGFLFDLGVSSAQLDRPEKGFSYQHDAPLDMRMNPDAPVPTAEHLVNNLPERDLARIIREYGEERWASRIAAFITQKRRDQPISTTAELVEVIKAAIPVGARRGGPHPAKRTFQALRIAVNDELGVIEPALCAGVTRLKPGGRMAVIAFHSLEDRIVKRTFQKLAGEESRSHEAHLPVARPPQSHIWVRRITKRPIVPTPDEIARNPRARSAKLRIVEAVRQLA